MKTILKTLRDHIEPISAHVLKTVSQLPSRALAWGGLALAAVILLSVNMMAATTLRGMKADLTEDRLFTISPGTKAVLATIDEPITARLYFSRKLGEAAPSYARYFERIRSLLEQYRDLSGGKLVLDILDPEPFSDAEDRAVASGLRGVRLNAEGEVGYFGLAATNSTDNLEVISFFQPDRESFVEYDLTKLIHALANPKKHVAGLITSLPLDGGKTPGPEQQGGGRPTPPWAIMSQVREFFDVETIDQSATEIPKTVDVLMIAQPTQLSPETAYAVDQFALKGGKVLVFIDPVSEAAQYELMQKQGSGRAELTKLLRAWGVDFDPTKVAADITHARRISFGRGPGQESNVTEFVVWLGLDQSSIDQNDVLSNGISLLNVASAGVLTPMTGATTTVTPIIKTSANAMEVSSQKVGMGADPIGLLRAYQAGGKELMLAARITGDAKTAFPDGKPSSPKPQAPGSPTDPNAKTTFAADPAQTKSGKINAIVVADSDLLADRFWVETRRMLGQEMAVPLANNASFVVGALENLTGSDAMIGLRGRGIKDRPFTLVEDLRRDAERQYREKEQALTERLKAVETELRTLEQKTAEGGNVILSDAERKAVDKAKAEMLSTRRELRDVKLALRQSIDRLDGWLKFANIALVPLLIALGGAWYAVWRRRKLARTA